MVKTGPGKFAFCEARNVFPRNNMLSMHAEIVYACTFYYFLVLAICDSLHCLNSCLTMITN